MYMYTLHAMQCFPHKFQCHVQASLTCCKNLPLMGLSLYLNGAGITWFSSFTHSLPGDYRD